MERKIEMATMGTAAGALLAALAGAIGGGHGGRDVPISRPAKRTHYDPRGRCRPTKGFLGGARHKGSNAAKRGARLAAKRAKASRRVVRRRKAIMARVGPAIRSGAIRGVTFGAAR